MSSWHLTIVATATLYDEWTDLIIWDDADADGNLLKSYFNNVVDTDRPETTSHLSADFPAHRIPIDMDSLFRSTLYLAMKQIACTRDDAELQKYPSTRISLFQEDGLEVGVAFRRLHLPPSCIFTPINVTNFTFILCYCTCTLRHGPYSTESSTASLHP